MLDSHDFQRVGARYFDSGTDPYPLFDALRAKAPVWLAPWGDVFVSSYDYVLQALANKTLRSPSPQLAFDQWSQLPRSTVSDWMLYTDGDQHNFLRQALVRPFSSTGMVAMQSVVERVVRECLFEGTIDDVCEVVSQFTRAVPERVISDLLGFPREDIPRIRDWATTIRDLMDGTDKAAARMLGAPDEMQIYFVEHLAQILKTGAEFPPLLSGFKSIIDQLGIEVAGSNAAMLALAGHETTVHLLGNILFHLAREPDHWQRLRKDRTLVRNAVEETLRLESPVQKISRVSTQPTAIGEDQIADGSPIVLLIGAANRDPARFEAPHRFDLGRDGPPHLAFGRGAHACIGRPLAEMEASAVLNGLLARWSRFEMVDSGARWLDNSTFRGLEELHLRFHA